MDISEATIKVQSEMLGKMQSKEISLKAENKRLESDIEFYKSIIRKLSEKTGVSVVVVSKDEIDDLYKRQVKTGTFLFDSNMSDDMLVIIK